MGGHMGRMAKKSMDYFTGPTPENSETCNSVASFRGTPFVLTRTSSQYFDEDGHLAHEFYKEITDKNAHGKVKLKRITKGLRKQGEIKLDIPRLNVNFPIIIYEG